MIAEFADEHQRRIAYFQGILGEAAIPIPLVRAECFTSFVLTGSAS